MLPKQGRTILRSLRRQPIAIGLLAIALALPAHADAGWVAKGRGFGHGTGMSQYGALGMAEDGRSYREILKHYYTGIDIDKARERNVRVLIAPGLSSIGVRGATKACGKNLNPGETYSFRLESGNVSLRRPNGSQLANCGKEGVAKGGKSVVLSGVGVYRGDLRARNVGGSLYAINRVGIEGYVKGVIPNESFASWPQAALRSQAVAARSYALSTTINGDGYDLYDDTRSQVYSGKGSEHGSTNQAAEATSGEVIKSGGEIATAFFFSTSGGQTENSEFAFAGGSPRPWLKAVNDPLDRVSPYHRWKFRLSQGRMESELSGLFGGNLKRIEVLKTGRSPRIVQARVVGSRDSTVVSGSTLQIRLGLRSTWVRFEKR
jgi:stage II sporulation protein D